MAKSGGQPLEFKYFGVLPTMRPLRHRPWQVRIKRAHFRLTQRLDHNSDILIFTSKLLRLLTK